MSRAIEAVAFAKGDDVLKVGLIGCGGRGTGAAAQALKADKNVKLTAMGDAFADRLASSLATLRRDKEIVSKIDVADENCFIGFDAYKKVIASGVDVVLLCTPPGFRPIHLKAAVEANKHVFAEKPCAVDGPGVRSVLETCEQARKKSLSIVSGLCLRYHNGFQETVKRIHEGEIGDIVSLQANDLRGPIWIKERTPKMTEMEYQMRNWYYFTWLSGDFNVEQHVHFLDACAWLMKDTYPLRAVGQGGRQVRNGDDTGHIFDHHSVVYEFANGVRLHSHCRQQKGCEGDMAAYAIGTKGTARLSDDRRGLSLNGAKPWKFREPANEMYQVEHDELFKSIRDGKPVNNGTYMANSTLLAILGRMATYTGQVVTWQEALESKEDLSPEKYDWDAKLRDWKVAQPGVTKLS